MCTIFLSICGTRVCMNQFHAVWQCTSHSLANVGVSQTRTTPFRAEGQASYKGAGLVWDLSSTNRAPSLAESVELKISSYIRYMAMGQNSLGSWPWYLDEYRCAWPFWILLAVPRVCFALRHQVRGSWAETAPDTCCNGRARRYQSQCRS